MLGGGGQKWVWPGLKQKEKVNIDGEKYVHGAQASTYKK